MVSSTTNASNALADSISPNTTSSSISATAADSTTSFSQQLLTALESFLGQSGSGSQISITDEGQNSGASQYLVTLTAPTAATPAAATPASLTTSAVTPASASPAQLLTPAVSFGSAEGMAVTALQGQMQSLQDSWSSLTPSQVAFQLANAAGTGGGAPTATVPGTTLTFGDLNQVQQLAYQYGTNYGTDGLSMQDFLTQNAGPNTPWNLSYNQIQANPDIQAAAGQSSQLQAISMPPNEYATPPATSGNADNLPNPALIQYLPQDEQAAAYAAVAAEGVYGTNIAAAAQAYADGLASA
jgi:hypothetical protein